MAHACARPHAHARRCGRGAQFAGARRAACAPASRAQHKGALVQRVQKGRARLMCVPREGGPKTAPTLLGGLPVGQHRTGQDRTRQTGRSPPLRSPCSLSTRKGASPKVRCLKAMALTALLRAGCALSTLAVSIGVISCAASRQPGPHVGRSGTRTRVGGGAARCTRRHGDGAEKPTQKQAGTPRTRADNQPPESTPGHTSTVQAVCAPQPSSLPCVCPPPVCGRVCGRGWATLA